MMSMSPKQMRQAISGANAFLQFTSLVLLVVALSSDTYGHVKTPTGKWRTEVNLWKIGTGILRATNFVLGCRGAVAAFYATAVTFFGIGMLLYRVNYSRKISWRLVVSSGLFSIFILLTLIFVTFCMSGLQLHSVQVDSSRTKWGLSYWCLLVATGVSWTSNFAFIDGFWFNPTEVSSA